MHPDDAARMFLAEELGSLGKTEMWHSEFRLSRPVSNALWASIRGRVIERDPEGKPCAWWVRCKRSRSAVIQQAARLVRRNTTAHRAAEPRLVPRPALHGDHAGEAQSGAGGRDIPESRSIRPRERHAWPGDRRRLLQEVSSRLRENLREADTIGRLGGDEFTVIVEQADEPLQLEHVAENIRAALSTPLMVGDQEIYLNASIGLSVYPRDSEDAEQLLSNADTAMYRARAVAAMAICSTHRR
jgi:hypothetical protein